MAELGRIYGIPELRNRAGRPRQGLFYVDGTMQERSLHHADFFFDECICDAIYIF